MDGCAESPLDECSKFEEKIIEKGGIELFLGGIGADGHLAFNEPGSSLSSRTRVKTLAYDTIAANARSFGGSMDQVPKMAMTIGVGTIMEAREVCLIITGITKAYALAQVVEEGVNHMVTVSMLQMHRRACIVCDEDATMELKVKTVKYFNGLRQTHNKLMDSDPAGDSNSYTTSSLALGSSPQQQHRMLDSAYGSNRGAGGAGGTIRKGRSEQSESEHNEKEGAGSAQKRRKQ